MSAFAVHPCSCPTCRSSVSDLDRALHRQINLLISRLDERQRRWFAALEATRLGHGGAQRVAEMTGISRHTILRGQRELAAGLVECPPGQVRRPGAGRPARDAQDPELRPALEALLAPETAGDPMGRRAKTKRSSLQHLSEVLAAAGHPASRPTVARLMRELGYSPKANTRRAETRRSPERTPQFEHIAAQRARFEATGEPIISVDSKKKGVDRGFQEPGAGLVPAGGSGSGP